MKSINQHNRNIWLKSKFETLLLWSLFIFPLIVVVKIYTWLSPSGFWEQIVALIIIPIIYIILFAVYLEIIQMVEG